MTQPVRGQSPIENISKALNKAQSELGAVVKGSDNPFFKSKYADINAVIKVVKPVLNANGITYLQAVNTRLMGDQLVDVVDTILIHESGESIQSSTRVVTPPNHKAQEFGAAITYSRRFALQSLLGLPAEDDDGNIASGKKVTAKNIKKPTAKKEETAKKVSPSTVAKKNSSWS